MEGFEQKINRYKSLIGVSLLTVGGEKLGTRSTDSSLEECCKGSREMGHSLESEMWTKERVACLCAAGGTSGEEERN